MHMCSAGPLAHNDVKVRGQMSLVIAVVDSGSYWQPGNLLISDDGEQLVLMDLGSSRNAEVEISNRFLLSSLSHHVKSQYDIVRFSDEKHWLFRNYVLKLALLIIGEKHL